MALSAAEQKSASVQLRDNIVAGGQHVKENSLVSSMDFSKTIIASGSSFKTDITGATTSLGAMLGGIGSMMGYMSGGAYGGGGISYDGGMSQKAGGAGSNWGGTSIGGGGGHIGSGASYSGWGAQASSSASKGGSGSYGGVKWHAVGGVVNKPQIVGVGESGPEAIIPLGQLPGMVSQAMGGVGGHSHAIYIDGKRIADAVGTVMISRTRQSAGLKVR
jgi:hypothetical protein